MRVKTTAVIQTLKSHARWIDGLPGRQLSANIDRDYRVSNIVEGCLCVMAASAYCDIRQWIAHRPRRKQLKQPIEAVWTRQGRKAIQELLKLTISELEASRGFRRDVDVGPLPISEPTKRSPSHMNALNKGRDRHFQKQHELERASLERRGLKAAL